MLVFTGLWTLTLSGGVWIVLLSLTLIGYLPYSDRPGPGWQAAHIPTVEEMQFFWGWAVPIVAPVAVYSGALLFVLVRALGWFGTPVLELRIVGMVVSGYLGLLILSTTGWYIAIAPAAVYAGAALASGFGVGVLPKFRGATKPMPRWIRVTGAGVVLGTFGALFTYPLWPVAQARAMEVELVQVTPSAIREGAPHVLRPEESALLESLGVRGVVQLGISGFASGDEQPPLRMLIVMRGPLAADVELHEPRDANIVYIQDGNVWRMHPQGAHTSRKTVSLRPSSDGRGLSYRWRSGSTGSWREIVWWPRVD